MTSPITNISERNAQYLIIITGEHNFSYLVQGLEAVTVAYRSDVLGERADSEPPYSEDWNRARETIFDADHWGGDFFSYNETYEDGSFTAQRITG